MADTRRNGLDILLSIRRPEELPAHSKATQPMLYLKVKYALDCLQGDYNTRRALKYISEVYNRICCMDEMQQTPLHHKVMRMIIPELEIHAPHILVSSHYAQYKEDRDHTDTPKIDEPPPRRKK